MRSHRWFAVCLLAGAVACNTSNAPTPGSGGTGPAVDAGPAPVPDAGPAPSPDAGPPPGPDAGTADAGTGGTGGSGGGTDGGTAADDCNGLVPSALPARIDYNRGYAPYNGGFCGLPVGDDNGAMAVQISDSGHPSWDLISRSGVKQGSVGFWRGELFAASNGFVGYGGDSGNQFVVVDGFDEAGAQRGTTSIRGGGIAVKSPNGGLLVAGRFALGYTPPPPTQGLWMFNDDGTLRWGPSTTSQAAIFGMGTDLLDHTVVISDGGGGNIEAQWFDANGVAMNPPSVILRGFVAGTNTWFETAPLIDNSLAMRRVDAPDNTERRTSQWLLILPSGQRYSIAELPAWLSSRPNTNMTLVDGRRAYAFTPVAQDAASCSQSVDVVSKSGSSCGTLTFPVDGNACTTRELRIGRDGTVLQMLPYNRETVLTGAGAQTCTLRFWPAALR